MKMNLDGSEKCFVDFLIHWNSRCKELAMKKLGLEEALSICVKRQRNHRQHMSNQDADSTFSVVSIHFQ